MRSCVVCEAPLLARRKLRLLVPSRGAVVCPALWAALLPQAKMVSASGVPIGLARPWRSGTCGSSPLRRTGNRLADAPSLQSLCSFAARPWLDPVGMVSRQTSPRDMTAQIIRPVLLAKAMAVTL